MAIWARRSVQERLNASIGDDRNLLVNHLRNDPNSGDVLGVANRHLESGILRDPYVGHSYGLGLTSVHVTWH